MLVNVVASYACYLEFVQQIKSSTVLRSSILKLSQSKLHKYTNVMTSYFRNINLLPFKCASPP